MFRITLGRWVSSGFRIRGFWRYRRGVKAISPQAPMTNIWLGDDFFHNGAFRETYGFDYVQQLEAQKTDVPVQSKEDMFDFFLRNVNFAGAAQAAKMENLPRA